MASAGRMKFHIREKKKFYNIPGTRLSAVKASLLLSTGIVSLDSILGGGIPVGSVLLIEEDDYGVFSRLMVKYFLAEGIACDHGLYVASLDSDANQLVSELPQPVDSDPEQIYAHNSSSDLKIAWRYKDVPAAQSAPSPSTNTTFGHNFDLTVTVPKEVLLNSEIACWPHNRESSDDQYHNVLQQLQDWIIQYGHSTETDHARKTILRVGIHSIGSPLWPDADSRLPHFFYCLRAVMQSSYSACVVTIPTKLLKPSTVDQCEHLSDNAICLESLANNSNPAYTEYSGLLSVRKLSAINTLATHIPETIDWAFKLRKRRFIIEKLHLPPELEESSQREQDDSAGLGCSSNRSSKLDF